MYFVKYKLLSQGQSGKFLYDSMKMWILKHKCPKSEILFSVILFTYWTWRLIPKLVSSAENIGMSFDSVVHSKAGLTANEAAMSRAEAMRDREQELQEIRAFENQSKLSVWGLRGLAIFLLCTLAFLWIYYRWWLNLDMSELAVLCELTIIFV